MQTIIPKEMFFYQTLKKWNEQTFKGILPIDVLHEEISIKNRSTEEHEHFWTLTHNKKKYLIKSTQKKTNPKTLQIEEYDVLEDFPIRITDTSKITHYGKVMHVINKYQSVKIGAEQNHTTKEIIDSIFSLDHTQPRQFLLMKLIAFTSYVNRINCRICTESGFGKDSVFKTLNLLMNNVCTINPRSTATVEYRLTNKVLVLNELSNLSGEQVNLLQELMLMIGDMSTSYNKSTRGKKDIGSFDTYDISELSLVILYNNIEYYERVGQEDKYFDNVFQGAVPDRFLPLKLSGRLLIEQFDTKLKTKSLIKSHGEEVKKLIKSLTWYKQNWNEFQTDRWQERVSKPFLKGRHPMHYLRIKQVMQCYAESQTEYDGLVNDLNNACNAYNKPKPVGDDHVLECEEEIIR